MRDRIEIHPGVFRHFDHYQAVYTGTADRLVSAVLVLPEQLPGQPGNGRGMCTHNPEGTKVGKGSIADSRVGTLAVLSRRENEDRRSISNGGLGKKLQNFSCDPELQFNLTDSCSQAVTVHLRLINCSPEIVEAMLLRKLVPDPIAPFCRTHKRHEYLLSVAAKAQERDCCFSGFQVFHGDCVKSGDDCFERIRSNKLICCIYVVLPRKHRFAKKSNLVCGLVEKPDVGLHSSSVSCSFLKPISRNGLLRHVTSNEDCGNRSKGLDPGGRLGRGPFSGDGNRNCCKDTNHAPSTKHCWPIAQLQVHESPPHWRPSMTYRPKPDSLAKVQGDYVKVTQQQRGTIFEALPAPRGTT